MYIYQCSKEKCQSKWILQEGKLNGFLLTCPVCGKGSGIYVSQIKGENQIKPNHETEEITICIDASKVSSGDEAESLVSEFIKRHSLCVVSKIDKSTEEEMIFTIQYKFKNKGA